MAKDVSDRWIQWTSIESHSHDFIPSIFSSLDGVREQSMKSIIRAHRFHWMKGLIQIYFVMLVFNRLQTNVTCRLQWKKLLRRHKNTASQEAQNLSKVWKVCHQNPSPKYILSWQWKWVEAFCSSYQATKVLYWL